VQGRFQQSVGQVLGEVLVARAIDQHFADFKCIGSHGVFATYGRFALSVIGIDLLSLEDSTLRKLRIVSSAMTTTRRTTMASFLKMRRSLL
jgi:hypothetical protein